MALSTRWTTTGRCVNRSASLIVCLVVMTTTSLGCHRSLFPSNTPRTQYETYDRMRSRYVPLEEPDVFGNPQPALRSRLSQDG